MVALFAALCLFPGIGTAQRGSNYYIVVLKDPPLAQAVSARKDLAKAASVEMRAALQARQAAVIADTRLHGTQVLDSTQILLNAIYVAASPAEATRLASVDGVARVQRMYPIKRTINKALDLVTARSAWSQVGGSGNAGAGVKIAILDSGIDLNHPAFKSFSSAPPSGYPKCRTDNGDCSYTNNKVIVARSYVSLLNFAFGDDPIYTRPDDNTPRDRVGHGTATAMVAAGQEHDSPIGRISGVAPRAYLGNYKIFGSPGVNDTTFASVVIRALEDVVADGMDIASMSLGAPAGFGPLDANCGANGNEACDAFATAIQNAVQLGLTVTTSAGNNGGQGANAPALNTIGTPGTAPGAITVGATTNSHIWYNTLSVLGTGVPADLQSINARFTNGPQIASTLQGTVVDAGSIGVNRLACAPLPDNSLSGKLALIDLGSCTAEQKVLYAQQAGAIGVIFAGPQGSSVYQMYGLENTSIPSLLISYAAGASMRTTLNAQSRVASIGTGYREVAATPDQIAVFSSQGPAIGTNGVKPELVAVGTDLYMATQSFDPAGDMYSPTGYVVANGTSFSAPLAAGAAALVKQKRPGLSPGSVKSLLVNSANASIVDFDNNGRQVQAAVTAMGAGRLDTNQALQGNLSSEPSTISLGDVSSGGLPSQGVVITNLNSTGTLNLTARVEQRNADTQGTLVISPSTFALAAGRQTQVTVRLTGLRPRAGKYDGFIVLSGGAVDLRIPYTYFVGSGTPWNMYSLAGEYFDAIPGTEYSGLLMKVIDQNGLPIQGVSVRGSVIRGNGSIVFGNEKTDQFGIVEATYRVGSNLGDQVVRFTAGNLYTDFTASVFAQPAISANGIVDAASGESSDGFSAGQYISIYGNALSSVLKAFSGNELPLSLARVSVSFDNRSQGISVPGRLQFVSNGQINVQIPWECQGLATVDMKVSIGDFSSAVQSLKLRTANPAPFEYFESGSNRRFVAALDGGYGLISSNNPAKRGQVAQLYVNGLGPVNATPGSGQVSPSNPLATTTASPDVKIGGKIAQVLFSGLAPGIVGLYQVNVIVPPDSPTGTDVELVITQNGVTSRSSRIPVQ